MRILLILFGFLVICQPAPVAAEERTANRTVFGDMIYPEWILDVPEHYEFSGMRSNTDPQHRHPAQWKGQDWDPALWPAGWTPEKVIQNFYRIRIFRDQQMKGATPELVVGPKFYKISDLDRRRSLKLLADHSGIFERGYPLFVLRDWRTGDVVGSYSPDGMILK